MNKTGEEGSCSILKAWLGIVPSRQATAGGLCFKRCASMLSDTREEKNVVCSSTVVTGLYGASCTCLCALSQNSNLDISLSYPIQWPLPSLSSNLWWWLSRCLHWVVCAYTEFFGWVEGRGSGTEDISQGIAYHDEEQHHTSQPHPELVNMDYALSE